MSEKPRSISIEEIIQSEIPQRGEPPYFVHSGISDKQGLNTNVHGITEYSWIEALTRLGDLSNYGLNVHSEQIIIGEPEHAGLLTMEQINQAQKEGRVVFDTRDPEDVALLRKIDRG